MCGIVLVSGHKEASRVACAAMRNIQHRGTEYCGMAAWTPRGIVCDKGPGLVKERYPDEHRDRPFQARRAIGHLRYPTAGVSCAQPFTVDNIALCSNGDIPLMDGLHADMMQNGVAKACTGNDGELMTHMLAFADRKFHHDPVAAVRYVMENTVGAFSTVALINGVGAAFRDPWGFRPMVFGRTKEGAYVVASETVALRNVGAEDIQVVQPGELLLFKGQGRELTRHQLIALKRWCFCFFEIIYFAYPSTKIFGKAVATVRREIGARLAMEEPEALKNGYVVMAVPDSASIYADGYAAESGLRREQYFIRKHHKGRTFIMSGDRTAAVLNKFDFFEDDLYGASVVLLDDSIVRGTTMMALIQVLKERYGVREVHVRVGSPPIISTCHMGIDLKTGEELLAWRAWQEVRGELPEGTKPTDPKAIEVITEWMRKEINADSLRFISHDGMQKCLPTKGYCQGCITGEYPIPVPMVS
ncbi:MAG: amidophosphoribosyltransferase [Candidatus Kerfeldbacteria bacterium]